LDVQDNQGSDRQQHKQDDQRDQEPRACARREGLQERFSSPEGMDPRQPACTRHLLCCFGCLDLFSVQAHGLGGLGREDLWAFPARSGSYQLVRQAEHLGDDRRNVVRTALFVGHVDQRLRGLRRLLLAQHRGKF